MSDDSEKPSPFDRFPAGPIDAGVVHGRRIHGYDVPSDLARHYTFGELQLLALTGVPPDVDDGRAFELCLAFLSPVSVAEASVHAGRVARHVHSILGNTPGMAATLGIGLAEQARFELEHYADWLQWLDDDGQGAVPDAATEGAATDAQVVRQFRSQLPSKHGGAVEKLGSVNLTAAVLAVLRALGLHEPHQLTSALVLARFAVAMAEAFATPDPRLWAYPLNLPKWNFITSEEE